MRVKVLCNVNERLATILIQYTGDYSISVLIYYTGLFILISEEKSLKDQVVTASKPLKKNTTYRIAMSPLQHKALD